MRRNGRGKCSNEGARENYNYDRVPLSRWSESMILAYDEFVDFIAAGTTPQSIIDFQPSPQTRAHVADLIRRQKMESLSPDEAAELNHYLHIEHVMRLAKVRARRSLP